MYKAYSIIRTKTGEVLEECTSMEAAEKVLMILRRQGEEVSIKTDKDNAEDGEGFTIEGLTAEEPEIEFGNDLGIFDEPDEDIDFG